MIRFWDTSALIKIYHRAESGHAQAVNLLHERGRRGLRHLTSMLVAVELVSVLVRRTGRRGLAKAALQQLAAFEEVELTEQHRDLAVQLALTGVARGADTVIAAQSIIVATDASAPMEFVTADIDQDKLVRKEVTRRGLDLRTILLPA